MTDLPETKDDLKEFTPTSKSELSFPIPITAKTFNLITSYLIRMNDLNHIWESNLYKLLLNFFESSLNFIFCDKFTGKPLYHTKFPMFYNLPYGFRDDKRITLRYVIDQLGM